jgi:hypothetical protein
MEFWRHDTQFVARPIGMVPLELGEQSLAQLVVTCIMSLT